LERYFEFWKKDHEDNCSAKKIIEMNSTLLLPGTTLQKERKETKKIDLEDFALQLQMSEII
jgi:hypothetical protein